MARIRKINVSQVEGNTDGVLPAGTIAAYEVNGEYVLRVHNGVTAGGVPFPNAPSIVHNNDINITVNSEDSSSYTWNFGQTGTLTAPGDIVAGGESGGHFVIDGTEGNNTSVRWYNMPIDSDQSLIRAYTGNPTEETDLNRGRIQLAWQDENRSGLRIISYDRSDEDNIATPEWTFQGDGNLVLPEGGDILDSNGNSVLGGGTAVDQNIWVQTFETDIGADDIPILANSVEYDSEGNVIALFAHSTNGGGSYYSVGKYTTTGTKIWTARFGDSFDTDGWGLAVDNNSNSIYVAGQSEAEGGQNNATLTKLDGSDGSIVWSKIYDFGFDSQSPVVDVASDGNPVMVGYASNGSDNYVATTKVDAADGSIIWTRSLDGQGDEYAYGMAVGPTGEIVSIGWMDQLGEDTYTFVRAEDFPNVGISSMAQIVDLGFGSAYGIIFDRGSLSEDMIAKLMAIPTDPPTDITFTQGLNSFTVKVTATSFVQENIIEFAIGADSTENDLIAANTDMWETFESFTVAGVVNTYDHMLVVKYNSAGAIQWQKAIQFDAEFDCYGADADIDSDGNIYVTGNYQYYDSDNDTNTSALSILKLDSTGAKQWSRRVVGNCETFGTSVVVGPDDKLYLSGVTGNNNNSDYTWVAAKYGFDGAVEWQRLIDNTDTWSFGGFFFFESGSGSNIAVKQDYVVLGGGFGFLPSDPPNAAVVQVSASGDIFSVGDWDFSAASFSGLLNDTASDITVVNAGKTDTDNSENITTTTAELDTEVSGFLIGTLYRASGGNERLVNGDNELVLETDGTVTLPSGGTISEGVVTDNPTIELTPAMPEAVSQKLVIKGGTLYNSDANGISIGINNNTFAVSDTVEIYVYSSTYANDTLYWWIVPEEGGIADPGFGTVELVDGSGTITFTVDSDDYEFRVRVSPEQDNYDPNSVGVESVLINGDAPAFGDYHLHLTTGDLAETSIFLGTDDHNVRTTTDGTIQITTPGEGNNVWEFGADGVLTFPSGNLSIGNALGSDSIVGNTDASVGVLTQGQYGTIGLQWIDNLSNIGSTSTQTQVAGVVVNNPLASTTGTVQIVTGFVSTATTATFAEHTWTFGTDGITTFPDGTTSTGATVFANSSSYKIQTISFDGSPSNVVSTYEFGIARMTIPSNGYIFNEGQEGYWALDGVNSRLQFPNLARIGYGLNESLPTEDDLKIFAGNTGSVYISANGEDWQFGNDGDLTLPAGGDILDSTGVNQTAQRVEGTWTVTTGTNTYSFTVPADGTYIMWVKGNIPNGIITWNATASVSNTNVPAIGTQYAWNYTGGGSPISLTSIPDQIKGTAGTISTDATYAGTTSNRFDFGISNTSGASQTVYYGYTKI
jgi:hypothetical protein